MAAYNKFQAFVEHLAEKVHNLGSDSLKILCSNVAPVATNSLKADITEIAAGNGYVAGGFALTISSSAQAAGVYKLVIADLTFSAAGGAMAAFRYLVAYNDTPTSPADPLIDWWDYGSAVTLADGEPFTLDFDATNGMLQLT